MPRVDGRHRSRSRAPRLTDTLETIAPLSDDPIDPRQSDSPPKNPIMKNEAIPDGFLSVSEAVSVLARGMWGGLRRPHPVRQLKKQYRNVSVGFGPWKEQAGRCFRTAVIEGNVQVYVFAKTSRSASHIETEPVPLSIEVLERLIAPRGGLPDHAVRPSLKTAGGDTKLLALLVRGILLVSKPRSFF
jgi:hypothetical protein